MHQYASFLNKIKGKNPALEHGIQATVSQSWVPGKALRIKITTKSRLQEIQTIVYHASLFTGLLVSLMTGRPTHNWQELWTPDIIPGFTNFSSTTIPGIQSPGEIWETLQEVLTPYWKEARTLLRWENKSINDQSIKYSLIRAIAYWRKRAWCLPIQGNCIH